MRPEEDQEMNDSSQLPGSIPEENGIINLDSPIGKELGFTSGRFGQGSYLWLDGKTIYVSFIESRRRGNFRELRDRLHGLGFTIKVPTPFARMKMILMKAGFRETQETDLDMGGSVEVWVSEPPEKS